MLKSICLLLVIGTCVSSRDASSILSRLFKKSSKNATPLILVLNRNSLAPLAHDRSSYASAQESSEEADDSLHYLLEQLVQNSRAKSHPVSHKHYNNYNKDRSVYRPSQVERYHQNYNLVKKQEDKERNALRSPIFKSLLSLRNSLRCGARNECQDECSQNYKGAKAQKCNNKCEVKFECDEPTTPKSCDECQIDDDSCGDSEGCDEPGSTKGELVITEKPGCTRC